MKVINYENFMEIGPNFLSYEVESDNLTGHINNTLLCGESFLTSDTRPCVLMIHT